MSKIVLFWGPQNENGEFSNWWFADFYVDGKRFTNVEQYMMYMKAMTFKDEGIAALVMKANHPSEMKKLGRMVKNYDDAVWASVRKEVVKTGVREKVLQNESIKKKLLSYPVDAVFAENSPYDKIWGIGIGPDDPNKNDMSKWQGENLLGQIWSEIRKELDENK